MTKLMQWLFCIMVFGCLYFSVLADVLPVKITEETKFHVLIVSCRHNLIYSCMIDLRLMTEVISLRNMLDFIFILFHIMHT